MSPKLATVANLIKFGNAHAILIRWHLLGDNVHCDLGKIEIRANSGRSGNPRLGKDVANHTDSKLVCRHLIGIEVGSSVDEHLVYGIDMFIISRNMTKIDVVNTR